VELDGDKLRNTAFLHRYAVQQIRDLHSALVMGNENELGVTLEGMQSTEEAFDIRLIEGSVCFVKNAERRWPIFEYAKQQR
jgi:hypothetical protein